MWKGKNAEAEAQRPPRNQGLGGPETAFRAPAGAQARFAAALVKDVAGHAGDAFGLVPAAVLAALERELAPAAARPLAGRP